MKTPFKTAALAVCAVVFFSSAYAAVRNPVIKPPQEILVEFKKEISPKDIKMFAAKHGSEPASGDRAAAMLENIYGMAKTRKHLENIPFTCYKIDPLKINDIIASLKNESIVLNVQPNYYRYALDYIPQAAPDDQIYQKDDMNIDAVDEWGISFPNQWGFNIINADDAYNSGLISQFPARQVIVAVIDTGIKTNHPDLLGMTITGRNILNPGFEPEDDEISGGHGTHAAGVIGANTGNPAPSPTPGGRGIAGAAYTNSTWTAKVLLMPVKILDSNGEGTDADGAAGIIWAADHGANVINISVGGPDNSDVLANAVNYAYQKGCVVVAAAGNNNSVVWYPAACANVISVGATNYSDKKASFSNYGKIDVSAPGVDIWSCTNWDTFSTTLPAYYSQGGTSFAAPFVSGLAALIMLKYPGLAPDEVRSIIERSAVDVETTGYDNLTGWGRIDVARALNRDFNTQAPTTATYNWPNPFSPGMDLFTNIVFYLSFAADVSLSVYDGGGDLVWEKKLSAAQVSAGNNTVKWDGRNMAGKTVANGTYFYVLKTPQSTGRNKIVVIH